MKLKRGVYTRPVPTPMPEGELPPREKSFRTVVCRFWAQGRCTRGDQCKFLHSTEGRGMTVFEMRANEVMARCDWLMWREARDFTQQTNGDIDRAVELARKAAGVAAEPPALNPFAVPFAWHGHGGRSYAVPPLDDAASSFYSETCAHKSA